MPERWSTSSTLYKSDQPKPVFGVYYAPKRSMFLSPQKVVSLKSTTERFVMQKGAEEQNVSGAIRDQEERGETRERAKLLR